jgi:hypothetical protein
MLTAPVTASRLCILRAEVALAEDSESKHPSQLARSYEDDSQRNATQLHTPVFVLLLPWKQEINIDNVPIPPA